MAINPETQYPGKIAPSTPEYPYGQARNITTPGDGTGTPWEAALVNDIFGFQQALLNEAGVVPSGNADEVGASQYLEALFNIAGVIASSVSAMLNLDLTPGMAVRTVSYYDGWAGATDEPVGGGTYLVFTLTNYRAILGDLTWTPDEQGEAFTLTNGNVAVLTAPSRKADVTQWGAEGNGVRDCNAAIEAAARWLMRGEYPGGDLWFPKTDKWYDLGTTGFDFWQYLLDEQGLVDGDLFLPGGTIANGKLVRGTYMGVKGDGFVKCKTAKGASFTDSFLFKWGRYLNGAPVNAGVGMAVDGMDIEGPGVVGHTGTTYIAGAGGYASTTDANLGTTDTSTVCFNASLIAPSGEINNTRVRYFNKALENEFGFGVRWGSGSVQWCNIGVNPRTGATNFSLGDALEIELCAIGMFVEVADNIKIDGTVLEANQAEVLLQRARFVEFNGMWNEGGAQGSLIMRGIPGSPTLGNENIMLRNVVGLNVDSSGSVSNFYADRCALNAIGETWALSAGEALSDIVYDNCTISGGAVDLSTFSFSGLASFEDITVLGPVEGRDNDNFPSRKPDSMRKTVVTASPTAVEGFRLDIDNVYTNCRIEISGAKSSDSSADDVQAQTFRYVGVIVRRPGSNPVIDWDTSRSYVNNHTATGTNVPLTVAAPATTVISGGAADLQVVSLDFPTGTAISNTANTRFEAKLEQENDAVVFN